MTLRYQRQSFGQLHGWPGGVVPPRLSFSFLLHQGALVLCGPAAVQSLGYCEPSLLQQQRWGGGGLAGGRRVAAGSCGTVLYVPAEGFQLAAAGQSLSSTESS
jgi:hypothetical protein